MSALCVCLAHLNEEPTNVQVATVIFTLGVVKEKKALEELSLVEIVCIKKFVIHVIIVTIKQHKEKV